VTLDEYQKAAFATLNTGQSVDDQRMNCAYGLVGETGELVDDLKKVLFHKNQQTGEGHVLDVDKFDKEAGDVLWYIACGAETRGISLSELANGLETWEEFKEMLLTDSRVQAVPGDQTHRAISSLATYSTAFFSDTAYEAAYKNDRSSVLPQRAEFGFNLGGVLSSLVYLCHVQGRDIEEIAEKNIAKLRERYPNGVFDAARSVNREAVTV
jgi:NTP pyrophosphatase (non-canonical NTP hydrolase)